MAMQKMWLQAAVIFISGAFCLSDSSLDAQRKLNFFCTRYLAVFWPTKGALIPKFFSINIAN